MKKAICIIAVAAISFSSISAFAATPLQTMQKDSSMQKDTSKMKKKWSKKMGKKKMKDSTSMKKDTMKM